jgi:hypothetical protein
MNTTFSHNTFVRREDDDDFVNRLLEHDTGFEDDFFEMKESNDDKVRF